MPEVHRRVLLQEIPTSDLLTSLTERESVVRVLKRLSLSGKPKPGEPRTARKLFDSSLKMKSRSFKRRKRDLSSS